MPPFTPSISILGKNFDPETRHRSVSPASQSGTLQEQPEHQKHLSAKPRVLPTISSYQKIVPYTLTDLIQCIQSPRFLQAYTNLITDEKLRIRANSTKTRLDLMNYASKPPAFANGARPTFLHPVRRYLATSLLKPKRKAKFTDTFSMNTKSLFKFARAAAVAALILVTTIVSDVRSGRVSSLLGRSLSIFPAIQLFTAPKVFLPGTRNEAIPKNLLLLADHGVCRGLINI